MLSQKVQVLEVCFPHMGESEAEGYIHNHSIIYSTKFQEVTTKTLNN